MCVRWEVTFKERERVCACVRERESVRKRKGTKHVHAYISRHMWGMKWERRVKRRGRALQKKEEEDKRDKKKGKKEGKKLKNVFFLPMPKRCHFVLYEKFCEKSPKKRESERESAKVWKGARAREREREMWCETFWGSL